MDGNNQVITDVESVVETDVDVTVENVEPNLQNNDIREYGKTVTLPSDKGNYMRISVAEKVRCYLFDEKGTDTAFEMVQAYFEKIGMDTSFHSVYEESKLLIDYYEKQKAEEFIQERTEQIIGTKELLGIDMDQQRWYEVFDRIYEEGMREKKVEQNRNRR